MLGVQGPHKGVVKTLPTFQNNTFDSFFYGSALYRSPQNKQPTVSLEIYVKLNLAQIVISRKNCSLLEKAQKDFRKKSTGPA
jgi:hypothetical protein